MLQQTQVDRVAPKYVEFLRRFPTLRRLAAAKAKDVRRIWYPLGYNQRPYRLHALARETVARYGGRLPRDAAALDALPGVGAYTAAAVTSIAFGAPAAALDTNVKRVIGRVFHGGRPTPFRALARTAAAHVPAGRPGDFNQAMMDLGATVCSVRKPSCPRCPVRGLCAARTRLAP